MQSSLRLSAVAAPEMESPSITFDKFVLMTAHLLRFYVYADSSQGSTISQRCNSWHETLSSFSMSFSHCQQRKLNIRGGATFGRLPFTLYTIPEVLEAYQLAREVNRISPLTFFIRYNDVLYSIAFIPVNIVQDIVLFYRHFGDC